MPNRDPFRTLDDPEPPKLPDSTPSFVGAISPDRISSGIIMAYGITGAAPGYWQLPAKRPGWLRRLVVWLVLGWKWQEQ